MQLTGKKALVTGATRGIGKAIALHLSELGAEVMITGRNEALLNDVAAQAKHKMHISIMDLSADDAVEKLCADADEKLGQVDILVNNAGITDDNLLMRMKDEAWNNVLNVNLTKPFQLIRSLVRGMMKRRIGRIINITSVVGVAGNPGQANYCAAKAGIIGMSKSMAIELASRGITVNCVAPGFIQTDMTDKLTDDQKEHILKTIPMQEMGRAEDIAYAVGYLASDAAKYVTGQTLHVNGGMLMI